jgi:hypothetical protein
LGILIRNVDDPYEPMRWFESIRGAGTYFSISYSNIRNVLDANRKQMFFKAFETRYIVKHASDISFWNLDIVSNVTKAVICYNIDDNFCVRYDTMLDAQNSTNIFQSSISKCANHKAPSAGGFVWEFEDSRHRKGLPSR